MKRIITLALMIGFSGKLSAEGYYSSDYSSYIEEPSSFSSDNTMTTYQPAFASGPASNAEPNSSIQVPVVGRPDLMDYYYPSTKRWCRFQNLNHVWTLQSCWTTEAVSLNVSDMTSVPSETVIYQFQGGYTCNYDSTGTVIVSCTYRGYTGALVFEGGYMTCYFLKDGRIDTCTLFNKTGDVSIRYPQPLRYAQTSAPPQPAPLRYYLPQTPPSNYQQPTYYQPTLPPTPPAQPSMNQLMYPGAFQTPGSFR